MLDKQTMIIKDKDQLVAELVSLYIKIDNDSDDKILDISKRLLSQFIKCLDLLHDSNGIVYLG